MGRPNISGFGPAGGTSEGEIQLTLEEFEAIRLIDYDGMDQAQAAEVMAVSRQTVGRILKAGRSKVAAAIVEGLHLQVGGGCYTIHEPGRGRGRGRRGPGGSRFGK